MKEILKGKVDVVMGWVSRAFFSIQDFLQRNQKPVLALNSATEDRSNKWQVGEDIKKATNEVSKHFENNEKFNKSNEEKSIE